MLQRFFAVFWLAAIGHAFAFSERAVLPRAASTQPLASCSLIGEVVEHDVFAQTFLVKRDVDGQMETIPFSKWTRFLQGSLKPGSRRPQEIDSSDVKNGSRLCIVLDPSWATSSVIYVIEQRHKNEKSSDLRTAAASR